MKATKNRLALASAFALCAMADTAVASGRERGAEAFGQDLSAGLLADNTTFTAGGNSPDGAKHLKVDGITFDATAITTTDSTRVACGFKPTYVRWWNATDRITLEWFVGMADDSALKTAANGTQTLEVTGGNGGITVDDRGFRIKQNATLGAIAASKVCYYTAQA